MSKPLSVTVVYLGGTRGESGCSQETLSFLSGATIRDVAARVAEAHPGLAARLESVRWARNHEFADIEDELTDGDEIALIPPVAGGAPSAIDRVTVQAAPLEIDAVIAQVQGPSMGAVVTFIGTVRDNARGKRVVSLDYEAYEPMATRVLARIVGQLEERHAGARLAISHRTGPLSVGEAAVVIAAASPHREQAYGACRDAIEEIKNDLPVWKRETTEEGDEWVGWGGG